MDTELNSILRNLCDDRVTNDEYSYVNTSSDKTKWNIKNNNQEQFWKQYCELVYNRMEKYQNSPDKIFDNMHLAERPTKIMPIISHFTLKFHIDDEDDSWEPYDDLFLINICRLHQQVLSENFQISEAEQEKYVAVVLESASHWYETINDVKHLVIEFRIHFPYSRVESNVQMDIIRKQLIIKLRNENVLSLITRQPIGDWESIISSTVLFNPLNLYGSVESSDKVGAVESTTKIGLVLNFICEYITSEEISELTLRGRKIPKAELHDIFDIVYHSHFFQKIIPTSMVHEDTKEDSDDDTPSANYEKWLPMFLSVEYSSTVLVPSKQTSIVKNNKYFEESNDSDEDDDEDESDADLAQILINFINIDRFKREIYWMDIGKALQSAYDGAKDGLKLWSKYTKTAISKVSIVPDFIKNFKDIVIKSSSDVDLAIDKICKHYYEAFCVTDSHNLTVKTLAWYAREDSWLQYNDWHTAWCEKHIHNVLYDQSHSDIANYFYKTYWLEYAYSESNVGKNQGKWYYFVKGKWLELTNDAIEIKKTLSNKFVKIFLKKRAEIYSVNTSLGNPYSKKKAKESDHVEMHGKRLTKIISLLKSQASKSNIVSALREYFLNTKMGNVLNCNPYITGVENGVLEVCNSSLVFRNNKPEDYISMTLKASYNNHFTWEHPLVREFMDWHRKMFPEPSLLDYALKFASSCLIGLNSNKDFIIMSGNGDNSKSMNIKLYESLFGGYCIKIPIALLTEKGANSSSPSPQLARAKCTRVAFIDEPEDDITMNKGAIKRFTGGDSFFARMLHDNGSDVKATFKLVLTCNNIPLIPNADTAVKGRTKIIPYLSKWVDNPPETEEEQFKQLRFKIDRQFEMRIKDYTPAFLWVMVQYFSKYISEGLNVPDIVNKTNEEYWRNNDVYSQFIGDSIVELPLIDGKRNDKAKVDFSNIFSEFKDWFRKYFPGTQIPDRRMVRKELNNRWGQMVNNGWHGIQLKTDDDNFSSLSTNII